MEITGNEYIRSEVKQGLKEITNINELAKTTHWPFRVTRDRNFDSIGFSKLGTDSS